MPLSDHEQQILEEIERRLQQEDPRFANAVTKTSLHSQVSRRVRVAALVFFAGFVMLMLFALEVWVAIVGFAVMLLSALVVYHQLRRMGREQAREYERGGRLSVSGLLARLASRFRGPQRGSG